MLAGLAAGRHRKSGFLDVSPSERTRILSIARNHRLHFIVSPGEVPPYVRLLGCTGLLGCHGLRSLYPFEGGNLKLVGLAFWIQAV